MVRVFALPLLAVGSEKRSTSNKIRVQRVDQQHYSKPASPLPQSLVLLISGPSPAFPPAPYRPPLEPRPLSFHRAGSLFDSAG